MGIRSLFPVQAQKAVEKEEDASLLAKLDDEFSTLAQTEALLSLSHPSKIKSLKALLNKDIKREHKEGSFGLPVKEANEKVCQHVAIFPILFFALSY